MSLNFNKNRMRSLTTWLALSACTVAFSFAPIAAGAQDQPPPPPPPPNQQMSGDANAGGAPQGAQQEGMVVPQTLTIPAGTVVTVRLNEWLSSDHSQSGDAFSATLDQPLIVNGWVVARRGQQVMGGVSVAEKAGRVKGTSQLGVQLSEITLVDGQQMFVQTQLVKTTGGTSNGRDAAAIGATTGFGALIGAAANGGFGAAIGAGAGAATGIVGVLLTRGRPTLLEPETLLTFQLQAPVLISTERGEVAFQPVSQADYDAGSNGQRSERNGYRGPGYRRPYAYGYGTAPYPYYYPYNGYGLYGRPYVSIYGRFGLGPRFVYRGGYWRR